MDAIPGPWRKARPVVGNLLECLRPDFHKVLLKWADDYGGVLRIKFLWKDALIVTDPAALAAIMGRGDGALDKAAGMYHTINCRDFFIGVVCFMGGGGGSERERD